MCISLVIITVKSILSHRRLWRLNILRRRYDQSLATGKRICPGQSINFKSDSVQVYTSPPLNKGRISQPPPWGGRACALCTGRSVLLFVPLLGGRSRSVVAENPGAIECVVETVYGDYGSSLYVLEHKFPVDFSFRVPSATFSLGAWWAVGEMNNLGSWSSGRRRSCRQVGRWR